MSVCQNKKTLIRKDQRFFGVCSELTLDVTAPRYSLLYHVRESAARL